jgi:hypothetical protein
MRSTGRDSRTRRRTGCTEEDRSIAVGPRAAAPVGVAYLVLGVALLLTGGVTASVARAAAAKDRLRFENAIQHARDSIQSRLDSYISLLRGTAGLFAADPAVDRAEDRHRAVEAGFQTHLPKPVEPDHLVAVVAELVEASRNGQR